MTARTQLEAAFKKIAGATGTLACVLTTGRGLRRSVIEKIVTDLSEAGDVLRQLVSSPRSGEGPGA